MKQSNIMKKIMFERIGEHQIIRLTCWGERDEQRGKFYFSWENDFLESMRFGEVAENGRVRLCW